jgi:Ca-activated chloride channel family protein
MGKINRQQKTNARVRYGLMSGLLLTLAALVVTAQNPPASTGRAPRTVKLALLVTDKSGHAMTDLRQEDVQLFEDDKPQNIVSFAREDLPLSFGLIVDATGSMRDQLENALAAAKAVINAGQSGDDAFVARLRDKETQVIVDWIGDKNNLLGAVAALSPAHGQGSLIDALLTGSGHFASYPRAANAGPRRRALVLVSDGLELGPRDHSDRLLKALRQESLPVFIVCLTTPEKRLDFFDAETRRRANEWLKTLARETGGEVYFPKSAADFPRIADDIINQPRAPYVVTYESMNPKAKLRVKLTGGPGRDKYSVTARVLSN